MTREQMLIKMLERADLEIRELQHKTDFLNRELAQLRERLNYLEPQVFGGSTK